MTTINEGMLGGDLEDLVLPMLSVDEFASKLGDDAIVFGFYVSDREAAIDLNRFIQKSPLKIIDTEISPAPDQRGFYVVFFEVQLNDRLPEVVTDLLKEIEPLVVIEKWKMQIRGQENLITFSTKTLTKYAQIVKKQNEKTEQLKATAKAKEEDEPEVPEAEDESEPKKATTEPEKAAPKSEKKAVAPSAKEKSAALSEQILNFLTPSDLNGAQVVARKVVFEGRGCRDVFELVAFGPICAVSSALAESPMDTDLSSVAKEMRLTRMLGEGWSVTRIGGLSAIQHQDGGEMLILRDR